MEESVRCTIRLITRLDREMDQIDEARKREVQKVVDSFKSSRSDKKTQRTNPRRGIEIQTRMKYEELEKLYGNSASQTEADPESTEPEQAVGGCYRPVERGGFGCGRAWPTHHSGSSRNPASSVPLAPPENGYIYHGLQGGSYPGVLLRPCRAVISPRTPAVAT